MAENIQCKSLDGLNFSNYKEIYCSQKDKRTFRCNVSGKYINVTKGPNSCSDTTIAQKCAEQFTDTPSKGKKSTVLQTDPIPGNTLYTKGVGCDNCGTINKGQCESESKCYWNKSENNCKNKCRVRRTKGECEQYYTSNQSTFSDTIYNFDGKDHKCEWHPNFFNIDVSSGSTEGKCRDVTGKTTIKCIQDAKQQINTDITSKIYEPRHSAQLKNKKTIDLYCNHNYVSVFDNTSKDGCLSLTKAECDTKNNCRYTNTPHKCISNGKPHYKDGILYYMTDKECGVLNNSNCKQSKTCIYKSKQEYCQSKPINDLIYRKGFKPGDIDKLCVPLKAQIPDNYDVNLLSEENIDLSSFRESHNKNPPYFTSKYLCDVCHIRNKDISTMKKTKNPLFNINSGTINDEYSKNYCEKTIDKGNNSKDQPKPCTWLSGSNKCVSKCKQSINELQTKMNLECTKKEQAACKQATSCAWTGSTCKHKLNHTDLHKLKDKCISTNQYGETGKEKVIFPRYNKENVEVKDNYYNDLYCTWDGFECNNSIPCKDAQRVRCEDLGYDWYEGSAPKKDVDAIYPMEHKYDGKPILGQTEGICIFPNINAKYVGPGEDYVIKSKFEGEQGILLKWKEYGTGWWEDHTLYKRDMKQDKTTPNPTPERNTHYDLGENIIFIPFKIFGGDTPLKVKDSINLALKSYQYFVMNGEFVIWAETILDWVRKNYKGKIGQPTKPHRVNENSSPLQKFCGYNYYNGDDTPLDNQPSDGKSWDNLEVMMCNTIYDLRGIINIIPVINSEALLQIDDFKIHGDTGHIEFKMTDNKYFKFLKFIDSSFFNLDVAAKKKETLKVLNKYNMDGKHVHLPNNFTSGYGNLYEADYLNTDKYDAPPNVMTINPIKTETDQNKAKRWLHRYNYYYNNSDGEQSNSLSMSTNKPADKLSTIQFLYECDKQMGIPIPYVGNTHPTGLWENKKDGGKTIRNKKTVNIKDSDALTDRVLKTGWWGRFEQCNKEMQGVRWNYYQTSEWKPTVAPSGPWKKNNRYRDWWKGTKEKSWVKSGRNSAYTFRCCDNKWVYEQKNGVIPGPCPCESKIGNLKYCASVNYLLDIYSMNEKYNNLPPKEKAENSHTINGVNYLSANGDFNKGINKDLFKKCFKEKNLGQKTGIIMSSGSIESWNIYTRKNNRGALPKYQVVTLDGGQPNSKPHAMIKLLAYYNSTVKDTAKYKVIQPADIRKAAIWSMTRKVHNCFGDLFYVPDPAGTDRNNPATYLVNLERKGDTTKGHIKDYTQDKNNFILSPFNSIINWEHLLTYLGGNKNKIVRDKDEPGLDLPKEDDILPYRPTIFHGYRIDYINLTPNNNLKDYSEHTYVNLMVFIDKDKILPQPPNTEDKNTDKNMYKGKLKNWPSNAFVRNDEGASGTYPYDIWKLYSLVPGLSYGYHGAPISGRGKEITVSEQSIDGKISGAKITIGYRGGGESAKDKKSKTGYFLPEFTDEATQIYPFPDKGKVYGNIFNKQDDTKENQNLWTRTGLYDLQPLGSREISYMDPTIFLDGSTSGNGWKTLAKYPGNNAGKPKAWPALEIKLQVRKAGDDKYKKKEEELTGALDYAKDITKIDPFTGKKISASQTKWNLAPADFQIKKYDKMDMRKPWLSKAIGPDIYPLYSHMHRFNKTLYGLHNPQKLCSLNLGIQPPAIGLLHNSDYAYEFEKLKDNWAKTQPGGWKAKHKTRADTLSTLCKNKYNSIKGNEAKGTGKGKVPDPKCIHAGKSNEYDDIADDADSNCSVSAPGGYFKSVENLSDNKEVQSDICRWDKTDQYKNSNCGNIPLKQYPVESSGTLHNDIFTKTNYRNNAQIKYNKTKPTQFKTMCKGSGINPLMVFGNETSQAINPHIQNYANKWACRSYISPTAGTKKTGTLKLLKQRRGLSFFNLYGGDTNNKSDRLKSRSAARATNPYDKAIQEDFIDKCGTLTGLEEQASKIKTAPENVIEDRDYKGINKKILMSDPILDIIDCTELLPDKGHAKILEYTGLEYYLRKRQANVDSDWMNINKLTSVASDHTKLDTDSKNIIGLQNGVTNYIFTIPPAIQSSGGKSTSLSDNIIYKKSAMAKSSIGVKSSQWNYNWGRLFHYILPPIVSSNKDPALHLFTYDGQVTIEMKQFWLPQSNVGSPDTPIIVKPEPESSGVEAASSAASTPDKKKKDSKGVCLEKDSKNKCKIINLGDPEIWGSDVGFSCKDSIITRIKGECWGDNMKDEDSCKTCLNKGIVSKNCGSNLVKITSNICKKLTSIEFKNTPWIHEDKIKSQPSNKGRSFKPTDSPYSNKGTCKGKGDIKFTKIKGGPGGDKEFFKPWRKSSSRLFSEEHSDSSELNYGCIRDDIMNVDEPYYKLSCNTNTSYPIERDKHLMVNFIIQHSKGKLNISDRTKLVMMDEEELINKAADFGTHEELNEYTRPKLVSTVKDIWNPELNGKDSGGFENWDDYQQKYLNIDPSPSITTLPKLGVKKWDYEGCQVDFNNSDSTYSAQSCKDRYPGLCKHNKAKCKSDNPKTREAILIDCPETCNSQFTNLNSFSTSHVGQLSICTSRGRCKWSHDQDDANLLPLCDEHNERKYGSQEKCMNFKNIKVANCKEGDISDNCLEKKCLSLRGCKFTHGTDDLCIIPYKELPLPPAKQRDCRNSQDDGGYGGEWTRNRQGEFICKINNYREYGKSRNECIDMRGKWHKGSSAKCMFKSKSLLPLEDPCGQPITNFDKLKKMDKSIIINNHPYKITKFTPICHKNHDGCRTGLEPPDALKIRIILENTEINDQKLMFKVGDYIHIQAERGSNCSQFLQGHSKILHIHKSNKKKKVNKQHSGVDKTYVEIDIIIKGPMTTYLLPLKSNSEYDIGKCNITEHFRLKDSNNPNKSPKLCLSNKIAPCTVVDNIHTTEKCTSCPLIKNKHDCTINNKKSSCGWGNVKKVCKTIGSIDKCLNMADEGCTWNHDLQRCDIDITKDRDGNPFRDAVGCMKCGDLGKDSCNLLENCYWDKKKCKSCGIADDGENIEGEVGCKNKKGKCEWIKDDKGKGECVPTDLYPLIYEWLWYNKYISATLLGILIGLVVGIYIYFAKFFSKDKGKTFRQRLNFWWVFSILLIPIITSFTLYMVIPRLLTGKVPGLELKPADGKNGVKYYMDIENPGKPAKHYQRLYDEKWDDIISGDRTLRSMSNLSIEPWMLGWTNIRWYFIDKWNNLMNSLNNYGPLFILFIAIVIIVSLIFISKSTIDIYKKKNQSSFINNILDPLDLFRSLDAFTIPGLPITLIHIIVLLFIISLTCALYPEYAWYNNCSDDKYCGRELDNPYKDSMWEFLYTLDTNRDLCPEGCKHIATNKYCADTRSIFSIDSHWFTRPTNSLKDEKYWISSDTSKCPPPVDKIGYPYDWLCPSTKAVCKANTITYPDKEMAAEETHVFDEANDKCDTFYKKHGTCGTYDDKLIKELSINDGDKKADIICSLESPSKSEWCPFPQSEKTLQFTDDSKQHDSIDLWDLHKPVPKISPDTKVSWQNELRYEIVNQNYYSDSGKFR